MMMETALLVLLTGSIILTEIDGYLDSVTDFGEDSMSRNNGDDSAAIIDHYRCCQNQVLP
ncbi:hypothetical protein [Salinimonas chungwhensis]|uniref:hypothetical protein n=1 Tax=Salinimonas chungwhensis TaxID=265425 RepID=UPI00036CD602|nr:hypothetical protein [Salinimonas chungwhensis]